MTRGHRKLFAGFYFHAQGMQRGLQAFVSVNVAGHGGLPSKLYMGARASVST